MGQGDPVGYAACRLNAVWKAVNMTLCCPVQILIRQLRGPVLNLIGDVVNA